MAVGEFEPAESECKVRLAAKNEVRGAILTRVWSRLAPFGSTSGRESDERVSRECQKVRGNHGAGAKVP